MTVSECDSLIVAASVVTCCDALLVLRVDDDKREVALLDIAEPSPEVLKY